MLFIIRSMITLAFINHIGQKKNSLLGECPYTAWSIYLGMILTTYFGLSYWFYTRDNTKMQKITFVLVQTDLICIPIQLIYFIYQFFWTCNKKVEIEQLEARMTQKREQLYNKRIGAIEGKFLIMHHDQLLEKGLIPAINTNVKDSEKQTSKNKFDIY